LPENSRLPLKNCLANGYGGPNEVDGEGTPTPPLIPIGGGVCGQFQFWGSGRSLRNYYFLIFYSFYSIYYVFGEIKALWIMEDFQRIAGNLGI
jgi:hypothetical protein